MGGLGGKGESVTTGKAEGCQCKLDDFWGLHSPFSRSFRSLARSAISHNGLPLFAILCVAWFSLEATRQSPSLPSQTHESLLKLISRGCGVVVIDVPKDGEFGSG